MCGKSLTFRTGHLLWRAAPAKWGVAPEHRMTNGKAQPFRTSGGEAAGLLQVRFESSRSQLAHSLAGWKQRSHGQNPGLCCRRTVVIKAHRAIQSKEVSITGSCGIFPLDS